ncbi:cupredoxin domain-containing protein [Hymenobacter lutimineralis]|uniref:Cupredoxin domain-containing protein n=1 Tax=Hymenobacter lutimineralis TaxID=2606448 RepID=A0A5D6VHM3_9BACT|nr:MULTISPECIES: cupredoxin domain-containing protein [Hymenobacter]QIX60311.1 cupredoxin domain-containing protein [Hymenobacter sp. BT18]TYZ14269.1 cupredoxin domain-containing protein [Hymenobacter lutimineralis]
MDIPEILVTATGITLAALVVWYFFFSTRPKARAQAASGGVQAVTIMVKGGYTPETIEVECGKPVQLSFYRAEENGCSEEVLFPDFNLRRELPAYQTTLIELRPEKAGSYEFTCGMGMLRGRLIAR